MLYLFVIETIIPTYFLFTHLAGPSVKQVNMMIWPNLMVTRRQKN